jgi:hypothetical protein
MSEKEIPFKEYLDHVMTSYAEGEITENEAIEKINIKHEEGIQNCGPAFC